MKATGIIRKIDTLGRIVFPIEVRRELGWKEKDPLEILVDGENVVIRKYQACCIFCGEDDQNKLKIYKDKKICQKCMKELK